MKQIELVEPGRPIYYLTCMIADRSGIHSVLLPLLISLLCPFNQIGGYKLPFIAMGCLMLCTLPLFLLTFHLIGTKNQGLKKCVVFFVTGDKPLWL